MSERLGNVLIACLSVAILGVIILYALLPSMSYFQDRAEVEGIITVGQANFEFASDLPLFSNLTNFAGGTINESVSVVNARNKAGTNTTNLVDCYLRFSVTDNAALSVNYDADKFLLSDGYFYYKGVFGVGQTLKLIESFEVDIGADASVVGTPLDVEVKVEVMQATKSMASEGFAGAPSEWINAL